MIGPDSPQSAFRRAAEAWSFEQTQDACIEHVRADCPTCDCGMPRDDASAALGLLARMRFACGDNGKRMQGELEEYLRELKRNSDELKALRSAIHAVCADDMYEDFVSRVLLDAKAAIEKRAAEILDGANT